MTPMLGKQQIQDFTRDGYVVVRAAFDNNTMAVVDHWTQELAERPEEVGKHWVYHEKSRLDPRPSRYHFAH